MGVVTIKKLLIMLLLFTISSCTIFDEIQEGKSIYEIIREG